MYATAPQYCHEATTAATSAVIVTAATIAALTALLTTLQANRSAFVSLAAPTSPATRRATLGGGAGGGASGGAGLGPLRRCALGSAAVVEAEGKGHITLGRLVSSKPVGGTKGTVVRRARCPWA